MLQLLAIMLGAPIVLLLVLRPLVLWYWKVNRAIAALESIALSLEQMPAAKEYRSRQNAPRRRVA